MRANHIGPLVEEYYRTGTIDQKKMRSLAAVNAHCPRCSAQQGGYLSNYSKAMKKLLGFSGRSLMDSWSGAQKEICKKFGADFLPCGEALVVGISKDFDPSRFPINGLRHPPEGQAAGWYIWSGEEFSEAPEFFVPLHAAHLRDHCPFVLKYLGLAPGWRFLLAPGQEDVWFDPNLLHV
jgi:hypothetical protein